MIKWAALIMFAFGVLSIAKSMTMNPRDSFGGGLFLTEIELLLFGGTLVIMAVSMFAAMALIKP